MTPMLLSAFYLAMSSYVNIHYLIMVIPITMLVSQRGHDNDTKRASLAFVTSFVLFTCCLHGLASLLVGNTDNYSQIFQMTHLHSFYLDRQKPNLSTLWYFSMELFEEFKPYFTALLGGMPYLLVVPLALRLHRYPMVLVSKTQNIF